MSSVTITKILEGQRNVVFHVAIVGDGLGDLADAVLIDPATSFDPAMRAGPTIKLDCIQYDLTGFSAWLEYDQLLSDLPVWTMSDGNPACFDFTQFGGLFDRSVASDGSGKLLLSTSGLAAGDRGTIILRVRK